MQTIIVTGITGGLGNCLLQGLLKANHENLIGVYRNEEKFQKQFGEEKKRFIGYQTFSGDTYKGLLPVIEENVSEELVVFLNAFSITPIKSVGTFEEQEISEMIDGNLKQNVYLVNQLVSFCKKKEKKLRVINVDSGAADFPLGGWANYCAGKAYMNAFLSVLALENPDMKVVSIDPGVMDTSMQKEIRETSADVFSEVAKFIEYKEKDKLHAPMTVAQYMITRYVNDWKAESFREKFRT